MGLGAVVTTAVSNSTIASAAYNTNLANINAVENPAFTDMLQTPATQDSGYCGDAYTNQVTGTGVGPYQNYKQDMSNTPTSITLSVIASNNTSSPTATKIGKKGFWITWQMSSSGTSAYRATYTTVGN